MRVRWLPVAAILYLLTLIPLAAHAQTAGVTVDISSGYERAFRAGTWFPVRLTLQNSGPDVRGTLSFRLGRASGEVYSQPLDLPNNARKQIVLPVASSDAFSGNIRAQLTIRSGNQVVYDNDRIDLRAIEAFGAILGVISDDQSALPELSTLRLAGANTTLLRMLPADLPDRPELLQTFNVLFIHAADTSIWTDAQRMALRGWIDSGGHLVVGGDGRVLRGLADLLPATFEETTFQTRVPMWDGSAWTVPANARPIPVLRLTPAPNAEIVVRADGDAPLLIRRSAGLGTISVAAFGLETLRDAATPTDFWTALLRLPNGNVPPYLEFRQRAFWALQNAFRLPALQLPSILGLIGFLLVYIIVVGPINYLVLRRLDRREWAYLTIPLLVIVFSGAAYAWGTIGRGGNTLVNELSVVRVVSGSTQGNASSMLTIFSPTRQTYEVGLGRDAFVSNLTQPFNGGGTLNVLYAEDDVRLTNLLAEVGGVRVLLNEHPVPVPQVSIERLADGRVTIRNGSDQPLTDVAIVRGDSSAQTVPTIAPGGEQTVELALNNPVQSVATSGDGVFDRQAVLSNIGDTLVGSNFNLFMPNGAVVPQAPAIGVAPEAGVQAQDQRDSLFVFAWQPRTTTPVTLDGQPITTTGDALYVWPIEGEQ